MPVSQPAEWGRRFQDLATEAAQMSASSLRRYQSLLERVSRGELKPDEVQKQFRDYLQEQAGTSTREAVELSVGLLAGLLYAEARYREAMLDGLLPSADRVPPPPSPSGVDLTNWFQALSTYAAEQSARGMARHQMLVERVASGDVPATRVQEQAQRYLETHAPAFLGEVMDLGLTFVGQLQRSSSTLTDGLYDRVLGPDDQGSSVPDPPVVIELRGSSGSVVSSGMVVENARAETAEVVCRTSEFAARAFGRRFRAALEIDPARFTLGPGAQRDVALRLTLDPLLFAAGADYIATLQISGAGERDLIVQLIARAEPRPDEHPVASAPPPSPSPAKAPQRKLRGNGRQPVSAVSSAGTRSPKARRKRR
jgi:hypothetical protein